MAATCKLIRRISRDHLFTDCFKCQHCLTLEFALKEDHLTYYKWFYNQITKHDISQLCINALDVGSLKMVISDFVESKYEYRFCSTTCSR